MKTKKNIFNKKEFDLLELVSIVYLKKIHLILIIGSFALAGVFYSLSLPNIYRSEAILIPVEENSNLGSSMPSNVFNSLQGLNLFSTRSKKSFQATEKIKSFSFFKDNFLPNINKESLYYADGNNFLNTKISNNEFEVSDLKLYERYKNILYISQNNTTGFITLSIEHQSPEIAMLWVKIIIDEINNNFREIEKKEAELSVEYLNKKILESSITNVKQTLSMIISQELQKLSLIEANKDYVLKVLDPPYMPERKVKPSRILISFLGAFIGFIVFILFVLNIYFKKGNHEDQPHV